MPRKAKQIKPGVRKYGVKSNYTPAILEEALDKIRSGALTRMEASKRYNIPPVTLFYKLKQKHTKSVGRPIALSKSEEESFKSHLLILNDIGIPISMLDFRVIVKKYLDNNDRKIAQFQNNMPGYEWGTLFLERHPDLKIKVAHNIPRKRAQVSREQLETFFANMSQEIEGIPPENIFNMNESGFHDNPGKKKLLFRRDCRHPEIIKNATKSCYTVVFCVNAAGETLPPFFVYKGKKLWSDWLYQAPEGSRMAVSESGWITTEVFEEWLEMHFIPHLCNLESKKILICDNLSAHISPKALRLCEQHNIVFVCLVPNSTHLVQPLDVGYFSSVKSNWRKVLDHYRQTSRGKKVMALPKSLFAQLLRKALEMGELTRVENIKAGFRSSGLFPFSPETVLNKLPKYTSEVEVRESVGEAFHRFVEEVRSSDLNGVTRGRKFQLPVTAGKSVSAEEVEHFYAEKAKGSQSQGKETTVVPKKRGRPAGSKNKKRLKVPMPNDSENEPTENIEITVEAEMHGIKIPTVNPEKRLQNIENQRNLENIERIEDSIEESQYEELLQTVDDRFEVPMPNDSDDEPTENIEMTVEAEIHGIKIPTVNPEKKLQNIENQRNLENIERIENSIEESQYEEILQTVDDSNCNHLTVIQEYVVSSDGILISSEEATNNDEKAQPDKYTEGVFCVFRDEGSLFPGSIQKVNSDNVTVNVLKKECLGGWTWYSKNERCVVKKENIISLLKEHQITRRSGKFFIDDDILFMEWGE